MAVLVAMMPLPLLKTTGTKAERLTVGRYRCMQIVNLKYDAVGHFGIIQLVDLKCSIG